MILFPISRFNPRVYDWIKRAAFSCSSNPAFWIRIQNFVLYSSTVCFGCCLILCNPDIASSWLPMSLKLSFKIALNWSQLFPLHNVFPSLLHRYCSFQSLAFPSLKRERM
jgi:hypothetical protein